MLQWQVPLEKSLKSIKILAAFFEIKHAYLIRLSLIPFITRQIDEISAEGWQTLWRKLKRLVLLPLELFLFVLAFPLVMLLRLLRPFVVIRIGSVDIGRIGGLYCGDWYLSEKVCGQHQDRYLDWFYFIKSTNHVNRQWEKMWRRVLPIFPWAKLVWSVERLNKWFPGHEDHQIPNSDVMPTKEEHVNYLAGKDPSVYSKYNQRLECILGDSQPNLSFTEAEEVRGKKEIQQLGIPPDNPFICFHNRDSAFLDVIKKDFNWQYHDWRDSSIQNYLCAAKEMTDRGCYAVRLGAKVNEIVNSKNPKIIDYTSNGMRTDFLDIYLSAKCRFIICSDTGMSFPSEVFKRPLVYVNWSPNPLRLPVYAVRGLVIFKKLHLKKENHYMSFSGIMSLDFGGNDTNKIFDSLNLEVIENTPEEIRDVTIEMDERLNGTWETTKEDVELQERFWALFGPDKIKSPDLRIGTKFLRQNKELLI